MIQPHGGLLVDLQASAEEIKEFNSKYKDMIKIRVGNRVISDLLLLSTSAYSPLTGFMNQTDYESVVSDMKLSNGMVWTLPITLPVSKAEAKQIKEGTEVALLDPNGHFIAVLYVEDKYDYDKQKEAKEVYLTTDGKHPGVTYLYQQGDVLLGGPIRLIHRPSFPFSQYEKDPKQMREYIQKKGWKTVTAFQTRNPIHRAHEYIQKCALEITDCLLIHPLIGETKKNDVPVEIRIKSYEVILRNYYRIDRTLMTVFPAAMRYAGPKEAVFHAICRKNYGCTHMIIGRDHAGVGNYYGTYDAQNLIKCFTQEELGIIPLCFEHAFYCQKCEGMTTAKTCCHDQSNHIILSGTKVREMLKEGKSLPPEFTRPEVAQVLTEAYKI